MNVGQGRPRFAVGRSQPPEKNRGNVPPAKADRNPNGVVPCDECRSVVLTSVEFYDVDRSHYSTIHRPRCCKKILLEIPQLLSRFDLLEEGRHLLNTVVSPGEGSCDGCCCIRIASS